MIKDLRNVELAAVPVDFADIFSPAAVQFVATLVRLDRQGHFGGVSIREIREHRASYQRWIDQGNLPEFSSEVRAVTNDPEWKARLTPRWLQKRWVEITGPADDRKGMVNRANSGANVTLEDLEDATAPTWKGRSAAFANLRDFSRHDLSFQHEKKGLIKMNDQAATLKIRPRGLHLTEKHMSVDGEHVPAFLFDFGFSFFHTAKSMVEQGKGPSYYLAKTEHPIEATYYRHLFEFCEHHFRLSHGVSSATFLIEDILGAFNAERIVYEMGDYIDGLNCGRWDYIASFIYKFRLHPIGLLPDRSLVTMTVPFMQAYVDHVIAVCHRRGIHAMGGMAAQVPYKGDETFSGGALTQFNDEQNQKVYRDKLREVRAGHDGTWVAHPSFVPIAEQAFGSYLHELDHQIGKQIDRRVTASDLLTGFQGPVTEEGIREIVHASLEYRAAYLNGIGAAAITYRRQDGTVYANLMEDAATCRISDNLMWRLLHENRGSDRYTSTWEFVIDAIGSSKHKTSVTKDYFDYLTDPSIPDHFTLSLYEKLLLTEQE